jgi:lipoprotein signal peptidase
MSVGGSALPMWPWFLSVWVPCVLLVVLAYALFSRPGSLSEVSATALVFAGGAGNLADRLAHGGSVVDFININLPGLRNAVFNFADVAVIAGFFLFMVTKLRGKRTTSNSRMEQPA